MFEISTVLVLALGTFAVGTDAFVVAGFLPAMANSLDVSENAAGQSVTVFAVAYALAAPVSATLTARLPRRGLLIGALLVLAAANLGSALAPNLPVLILTRVGAAVGAAAFTPNAGAVGAALVRPELRGRALAVVIGGLTVATALGVPLGTLIGRLATWRIALGAVAGLCLAIAVAVRVVMPALPGTERVPLRARLAVLRRPGVLSVLPLTVLGMTAAYTAYAYSAPALAAVGVTGSAVAWMLVLYGAGAVLGNLWSGQATDRRGPTRVLAVTYPVMAAALALLAGPAAGDPPRAVVGALLFGWGAASWAQTPAQQHRLIEAAPQEVPLVVSLNSSAIYLGIALGTGIGGLALDQGGTAAMYGAGAAIAVAAWLFLLATTRRRDSVRISGSGKRSAAGGGARHNVIHE
ncbi:MFS transporter [Embleya sp. MST-111070]|uniref:MFS transporter n=1 Tax=Embleya sp. MST-111070 TaxID=3398231 RepID=UPI003F73BA2C